MVFKSAVTASRADVAGVAAVGRTFKRFPIPGIVVMMVMVMIMIMMMMKIMASRRKL